jgi:hypothetical protein
MSEELSAGAESNNPSLNSPSSFRVTEIMRRLRDQPIADVHMPPSPFAPDPPKFTDEWNDKGEILLS